MKSQGYLVTCSLIALTLNCSMLRAQNKFIFEQCVASYSEGSVSKPCTLCSVCVKEWYNKTNSYLNICSQKSIWTQYNRVVGRIIPFIQASISNLRRKCTIKNYCRVDIANFKCEFPRQFVNVKDERVKQLADCKCKCDGNHYGQTCNLTIPSHLSIDSFADVQNIVYVPIVYAADYATIYVYLYTTGLDLAVELQTETQHLSFDDRSCRKEGVPRLKEFCGSLYADGGISDNLDYCEGGPTYEEHGTNAVCAIAVNVAFPKDKLQDFNENKFLLDDDGSTPKLSNAKIVAKIEKVSVTIFNRIPNVDEGGTVLMSTVFGIVVIYKGKTAFEVCPVLVTIPQYSKKSESAPSFPRSQVISLTNLVVLEKIPECNNLGEPLTDWSVWVLKVNHDERNDPPFYQLFETPTISLEPFSLAFGKYKVKSMVRFVERNLDTAFAHCYFEIIAIPLQPLIFGGSLRYIYYKSNLQLISDISVDPNYPIDAQPKLTRDWYCNDTNDKVCDKVSGEEMVFTKYGPFLPGKSYNFTMSVKSPLLPLESCYQTIIISSDPIPNLLIECLINCGGKGFKSDPREIFYFKVFKSNLSSNEVKENNVYSWTYAVGNTSFINPEDIRQEEETPSWILIVKENSLQDNLEYTFKVTGGGESSGEAQIQVRMFKYAGQFHCTINPSSGIAGQTKFAIECNKAKFEQNRQLSLNVYFYDKFNESDEDGRLLGSNYMELIEDIVLTRGTVMVSATNMFGQFQKTHVKVSLTFPNLTTEFLNESMVTLDRLSENEGYSQKLSYISSLCDLLNKDPTVKEKYLEKFLGVIDVEDSINLVHLELLLSTTQSVLCNEENCSRSNMSDKAYELLSKILVDVSEKLVKELKRTAKGHSDLPSSKVNTLYTSLMKCSGIFLSVQNKELTDKDSTTVDYNLYNLYKVGNMKVLNSLDRVNEALALRIPPFVKHSTVRTELVDTWTKEDKPIYFTKGTKGNYSGSYLVMTPSLAKSLRNKSYHIVVNVMAFKNSPYWWSQTEPVSTQVVSVTIGYTSDFRSFTPIKSFNYPLDIFLIKNANLNTTVIGAVTQPDPKDEIFIKDLFVNVHKIYALKGEKISLKFVDLMVNDVFRVSVMKNRRPDYEMVLDGVRVNYSSPWYHSPRNIKVTEDDDVMFVGILPGASVPFNETRSYKFELQSARCQVWHQFLWDASSCSLGPNSSERYLHCQCTHLSSVAGFLGVPINTINPLKDYTLFLTIPENPFVFAFILSILFIYIVFMIWSYIANKRDLLRTSLLVLEDNISGDTFAYLVIVFTGARLYAGTTSHIGLILHGSETSSRSHILKASLRRTLTRDNDDWFLIYTPKSLGTISSVQLWTDHKGTSPNWYCGRIHVHDFSANRDYSFMIEKWFGVTQREVRVESFARPMKLETVDHVVDFFLTNIVFGFRESHLWVSIIAKHPRSPMTRAQRLSLAMVALVTTLLGCILFYDAAMPEEEDLSEYSVSTREAYISFYTVCISVVVTGVVFFAFSKSYTTKPPEPKDVVQAQRSKDVIALSRLQVDSAQSLRQGKQANKGFKYYMKRILLSLRRKDFYPVQARTGKPQARRIVVHKVRLILSWIFCTFVILLFCVWTVWLGLKIGKNKSLLWLTSIGMTLVEDTFVVDPVKIVTIALLFGLVQTQLCDLYVYDPKVHNIRTSVTLDLDRDRQIHTMRLRTLYKLAPQERLEAIFNQQRVVKKWWALIDIFDMVFSVVVIFCIIERRIYLDYFHTNTVFTSIVFNGINPNMNVIPSPAVNNVTSYSLYLQDSVFATIYSTQWYNKRSLTGQSESSGETGWVKTLTHRMIGVPRLRQIRVHKQACLLPTVLHNLSIYCNVPYSRSTEDTEYFSAQWNNYTTEFVDVIFEKSPWIYTFPDQVASYEVAGMYSQTGELFHGAGYVAELTRTRRKSAGTLLNLVDLKWIDMRTRIIFFEMSAYNVNNNLLTSITFVVEHLESSLVLASKTVRSLWFKQEQILLEVLYFLYSVIVLIKLLMVLNTIGPQVFFTSFWTLYDLCFVLVGLFYFIGYRIVLDMFANYVKEFQRSEKEDFFPFSGMFFTKTLDRYMMSLLLIFATARSLRLLKYESSIIHIKPRYTLYLSWPQILCVTFVLLFFMLIYQRLIENLLNCLYHLGTSHWLQHKMNFRDLQTAAVSPNTMFFVYIPCCLSCFGLVFYNMVLIESYSRANAVYLKMLQDKAF